MALTVLIAPNTQRGLLKAKTPPPGIALLAFLSTPAKLFPSRSREAKQSKWYRYFPERAQAVEFYRGRIRGLYAQAQKLETRLNEIANEK